MASFIPYYLFTGFIVALTQAIGHIAYLLETGRFKGLRREIRRPVNYLAFGLLILLWFIPVLIFLFVLAVLLITDDSEKGRSK